MIQEIDINQARLKMIEILADDYSVKSVSMTWDDERNCLWIDYDLWEEEELDKIERR